MLEILIIRKHWREAEMSWVQVCFQEEKLCHYEGNSYTVVQDVHHTEVENCPTLDELRFVGAPHALQNAIVERLGQLCRHGHVEVRLVALQYALQRELAHAQDLVAQIHDVLAPRTPILICKYPQIQDLAYPKKT